MKKLVCAILILMILLPVLTASAADKALYTTNGKISAPIYKKMDKSSPSVGRINEGSTIYVYRIYPEWLYVSCNGDKGYIPRTYTYAGKAIDKTTTPPWGVEVYRYVGTVGATGCTILSEPGADGEELISLGENARISIIELEDGWGKLAYYRRYGYVNINELKELLPVCLDAFSGTDDNPIATFTSYYVVGSDNVSVHGKEVNIGVNCTYIDGDIVGSGKTLDYNNYYGPFAPRKGYVKGPVLIETGWGLGNGGGVCQVSSTMYDLLLQLPGINILARRSHGPSGIEYLPLDMDAAVGNEDSGINFIFRNEYDFAIRFEAQAQDGALFLAVYRVTD